MFNAGSQGSTGASPVPFGAPPEDLSSNWKFDVECSMFDVFPSSSSSSSSSNFHSQYSMFGVPSRVCGTVPISQFVLVPWRGEVQRRRLVLVLDFIDLNARSRHRLCRVLAETEFIGACLPCIAPVHHSRAKVDALQLVAQKRSDGGPVLHSLGEGGFNIPHRVRLKAFYASPPRGAAALYASPPRGAAALYAASNPIQRTFDPQPRLLHHVQVNHCRRYVFMSQ